jgi:twitching motility two-component system response regulator PilH
VTANATVLVVDDNEDNVRIVSTILLARGFEVRIARDGKAALDSIRQQRPDLVLLDVMMPGLDGMQVLDHIKGDPHTAGIPVVMVTARTEDRDVLDGYRYGADYYVTKPFTSRQLLYAISLVLGGPAAE